MGDLSELRGLLWIASFIGVCVLLMSLIPAGFSPTEYTGRTIEPPTYFEAIDMQSFVSTWNHTMNETHPSGVVIKRFTLGYHVMDFSYRDKDYGSDRRVWLIHWYAWFIFPFSHGMKWINTAGIERGTEYGGLTQDELDEDYDTLPMSYTLDCSHFQAQSFFSFNESLYSSPSEAWANGGLAFLVGVDFDQQGTSYNAWDLIAKLMFFQLPDVHWIINALIAIPIWIATVYISFILILRAIGALFGGGA